MMIWGDSLLKWGCFDGYSNTRSIVVDFFVCFVFNAMHTCELYQFHLEFLIQNNSDFVKTEIIQK